ncbi:hypothetical protein LQ327_09630 [Actinomycetospora endophytica]|uniref:Oligosaccharide repeat unit polymerase n=1 Tax=Actinomycetospora endophytica TaxID=2291215 RepID=A0ABS8P5Y3_9PSEU|nr:hypothetical protein [Actinomycetospora endophytica]MCD2193641.1 hypothetical protein [Actinomycetospora endophytica]
MRLRQLLHPAVLLLGPVFLSAAAWSVPGTSAALRGFSHRSEVTFGGLAMLAGWYLLCTGLIVLGHRCGAGLPRLPALSRFDDDPVLERRLFRLVWLLAAVGIGYSVVRTAATVDIAAALAGHTGNDLKSALGGEAGAATLRYATAVAAPMGIHLWRRGLLGGVEAASGVVLLGVDALFASRLAVLMAVVVFVFLHVSRRPQARVRWRAVALVVVLVFAALTLLNSLRNENYYTAAGVDSPLAANGYQLLTYLGAPFQVSMGVADAIAAGRYPQQYSAAHGARMWIPTFLRGPDDTEQTTDDAAARHAQGEEFTVSSASLPRGGERYASTVDVGDTLTTNSAFADVLSDYGFGGLLALAVTTGAVGLLLGVLGRYRSVVASACGVVGYGAAESWRTYLFSQGIVVFLLVAVLGGALALSLLRLRPHALAIPLGGTTE